MDPRLEQWRAEFWDGVGHIVRTQFEPFRGDMNATWEEDSRDERSVSYAGTWLRVKLEECSLERARVCVTYTTPWHIPADCLTYEGDPLAGALVSPQEGNLFAQDMPAIAKMWVVFMLLTLLLFTGHTVSMQAHEDHVQFVVNRNRGPKLRMYVVLSYDPSVLVHVHFYERVYLSLTAHPRPLAHPLPMADARALRRFIIAELNTPWSSWPTLEPQLPLTVRRLPLMELDGAGQKKGV